MILLVLLACDLGGCGQEADRVERHVHYSAASDLARVVAAGQLDDVPEAARAVDAPEMPGLPESSMAYADDLHAALGFAQVAEDLTEAAEATAAMAKACGDCHASLDVGPRPALPEIQSRHGVGASTALEGLFWSVAGPIPEQTEPVWQALSADAQLSPVLSGITGDGEERLAAALAACGTCHAARQAPSAD